MLNFFIFFPGKYLSSTFLIFVSYKHSSSFSMKKIVIAIDGYSSCGKSTMAKELARRTGYLYIDSGAMYRCVALFCLENGLFHGEHIDTQALKQALPALKITFGLDRIKAYFLLSPFSFQLIKIASTYRQLRTLLTTAFSIASAIQFGLRWPALRPRL